jgi:hypothetical protein
VGLLAVSIPAVTTHDNDVRMPATIRIEITESDPQTVACAAETPALLLMEKLIDEKEAPLIMRPTTSDLGLLIAEL